MIYKICSRDEWTAAANAGLYAGSANDRQDGFIHFSNGAQVAGTLARYYADASDLVLAAVDEMVLGDALKWEASRDGARFPHLYSPLKMTDVVWAKPLSRGDDGTFVLPDDCQ